MPVRKLAIQAAMLVLAAGTTANAQSLDFDVEDEASYQAFRDAVAKTEYVRLDYSLNAKPRVAAVTAGLLAFATNNPHATPSELATFVMAYDEALKGFAEGDPELQRNSNFMAAVRATMTVDTGMDGFDERVGAQVFELLDVVVPEPDGFESMQARMSQYDYARVRAFQDSAEWTNILAMGFAGRSLDGDVKPAIAQVFSAYLNDEGFEPVPDGEDDERFAGVDMALAMMPAGYDEYAAELAQVDQLPLEDTMLYQRIAGCIDNVRVLNEGLVEEIDIRMDDPPTIFDAAINMTMPDVVDDVVEEYEDDRLEISPERALISWNALILLQSQQQAAGDFATVARDFSDIQLQTNDTLAKTKAGIETFSGLATFAVGIATGSPGDVIGGLTDYTLGALEMAELFGGFDTPPAPEEQIFDQLLEIRQQIEDMHAEMNQRFDNIEAQLNVIYGAVATGFNAIGEQIGDLQASVDALALDMAIQRATLDRIEDALWGLAQDVLLFELTVLTNDLLDYRDDNAVDLPYSQGAPSFVSGGSDLFSWATSIAKNNTFAGDNPSQLTFDNASEFLTQASIGRNVNDLREFPVQLGLPTLFPTRVVGAAPWTQSAAAYVQLAKESPWYFAYMYTAQQGDDADLEKIIDEGEDLAAMMENGRSQELFDELFAGYEGVRDDLNTVESNIVQAVRDESFVGYVDPFGGLVQPTVAADLSAQIGFIPKLSGIGVEHDDLPLPDTADSWKLFLGDPSEGWDDVAAVSTALAYGRYLNEGGFFGPGYLWNALPGPNVDNDIVLDLTCDLYASLDGGPVLEEQITRRLEIEVYSFGDPVNITTEFQAEKIFADDILFWNKVRPYLTSGSSLAGTVIAETNGNEDQIELVVLSDNLVSAPVIGPQELDRLQSLIWERALDEPIVQTLQDELHDWVALLDAYATLSLPHLFEESSVARSAFRSVATQDSMALRVNVIGHYVSNLNDLANATPIESRFGVRSEFAKDTVDIALETPTTGHGYIDWMLAELRDLRDHAFDLAIDDTYETAGPLVVDAIDGVIANDVTQAYRVIEVDAATVTQPANGSVEVQADGSFVYSPAMGFTGSDSFTYQTFTSVTNPPDAPAIVHSAPATVVIHVEGGCAADANGDGMLNVLDFVAFQQLWQAGDPQADCNADGLYNVLDFVCFQTLFQAGCN